MSHQTQTHDDAVVLEVRAAVPVTPPKRFDRPGAGPGAAGAR